MTSTRFVTTIATALISTFILTATLLAQAPDTDRYWAQWRGPRHSGVSPTANPPLEWSETKNVRWKVADSRPRLASPVVWGDRLFVLTAVPSASPAMRSTRREAACTPRGVHRFMVMAIDRKTGKTIWERVAREQEPHEALAHRQRHLGLELADHRRRARLRLLRVVRPLRLRHERQAPVGEGPRRQAHAQRVRRRLDAGAPRQHAGRRLGSPGRRVVRRRARQARRQGAVARAAQRDRHLGDAARRRGERTRAGRSCRPWSACAATTSQPATSSGRATG